ncbi:MAG: hypothetical protein ACRDOS_11565, partial [Gaiellaceae bacterium]
MLESAPCDGAQPSERARSAPDSEVGIRPRRRHAILALLLFAAALQLAGPATPQPTIESKQAEAQQVLAQIQQIDAELGHAVEAYNAATIELDRIRAEQKVNERRLEIARS